MAKVTNRKCTICGKGGWMDLFLNHLKCSVGKADELMMKTLTRGINAPNPKDQAEVDRKLKNAKKGKGICVECYEKYVIPAKFGRKTAYGR